MSNRQSGMPRQKDAKGFTAKDHVFFAFLADHQVSIEQALRKARKVNSTIKETTVAGWLSKAKRLWAAGVVRDKSSRVSENVQPAWLQALRRQKRSTPDDLPPSRKIAKVKVRRQPDPQRRQLVESAAVKVTAEHFEREGYTVDSVESDNVGWDLEAVRRKSLLRLEVKGLSGSQLCVELTPNEYARMQEYRDSFRLCVVTNTLTAPELAVFEYSSQQDGWVDQNGHRLDVEERVAARCSTA